MKVTRFHATADGGSRFQEVEIPINQQRPDQFGHTILQSNAWASPSIRFVELPAGRHRVSWTGASGAITLTAATCPERRGLAAAS